MRALAVGAVLAGHGGVAGLSGGFLGVDVFFVLSGYLITSLLLAEHQRDGRLDLTAFWARRARRLLPALGVMVLTCWLCRGLFEPDAVSGLRADAVAALAWVANWRFALQGADYFSAQGVSPLQHTWSLGVEEQFYLIWPLALATLVTAARSRTGHHGARHHRDCHHRARHHGDRLRWQVAAVAGAGVLLSALWTVRLAGQATPSRLYFGTDCRAQALLLGAFAAALLAPYWPSDAPSDTPSADGASTDAAPTGAPPAARHGRLLFEAVPALGLLVLAVLAQRASGTAAEYRDGLLSVTAVAAVMLIGGVVLRPDGLTARVLSTPALVVVGRVSYGVYLWHLPVFLVLTGLRTGLTGLGLFALRCGVTGVLAAASWLLVERPAGALRLAPLPLLRVATASVVATAVLVSCTGPALQGRSLAVVADAAPPEVTGAWEAAAEDLQPPPAASKSSTGRRPLVVDVFGDSVGWTLARYLPATPGFRFNDRTVLGCGVARGPYRYFGRVSAQQPRCEDWPVTWADQVAEDLPDVVLLVVGRWETMDRVHDGRWMHVGEKPYDNYLSSELSRAIHVLAGTGARVIVATEPFNRRGERPDGNVYPEDQPERVRRWNALLAAEVSRSPGSSLLDLNSKLCPQGKFTWTVDGVQVRSDGVHLTPAGVRWLTPWLLNAVTAAAR